MIVSLFFGVLKVALGKEGSLPKIPAREEWNEMFGLAKKQTLIGVFFSGIERLPAEQRPPRELIFSWYAVVNQIEERNHLMDERTEEATRFFRRHGFKTSILKGQGIARLYPKPDRRQSGDIDIWVVGPDTQMNSNLDFERSRKAIYEFALEHSPNHILEGVNYHHIHYPLFNDTEVEVHIYPGYLYSPLHNHRLHKFFKMNLPTDDDTLSLAFNRIFILLHTYNHLTGHGVGLRQVMDYYYVLKNEKCSMDDGQLSPAGYQTVDWIKKLGMMRFARAMMWVMQVAFGLEKEYMIVEPDEKEGRFLMNEIFQTGNMGHYEQRNWGSLKTPVSRFFYNLRRDWHLLSHYPHEVCWQPIFSIWLNVQRFFWKKNYRSTEWDELQTINTAI